MAGIQMVEAAGIEIVRRKIQPDEIAQAAIDGVEIFTRAVEAQMVGAVRLGVA